TTVSKKDLVASNPAALSSPHALLPSVLALALSKVPRKARRICTSGIAELALQRTQNHSLISRAVLLKDMSPHRIVHEGPLARRAGELRLCACGSVLMADVGLGFAARGGDVGVAIGEGAGEGFEGCHDVDADPGISHDERADETLEVLGSVKVGTGGVTGDI
ncbi:hypothetical protein C8F04DRAFT_1126768, partial [Mycena alexandri]